MSRELVLVDYAREKVPTGVDMDDPRINAILVDVLSGDEVAAVVYDGGETETYDSSDDRIMSYYDGAYILYLRGVYDRRDAFVGHGDAYEFMDCLAKLDGEK